MSPNAVNYQPNNYDKHFRYNSVEYKHGDRGLNNFLFFELCARDMCEIFVHKHLQTIEYAKN